MPQLHLTEISVRALKGSDQYITYYDDTLPAFGLRCGKRSKTWVVLRGKKRERVTIGRYPDLTLAAARAEAKKLLAGEPEPRVPRAAYIAARDDFLEEHYRDSTSDWPAIVKLILNKHFKAFEGKQLADISDADIEDALDRIEGASARLHAYRVARTFFGWCVKPPRRYLKASPMAGYEPPGKDGKRSRILSDDELTRIWNASESGSRRVFRLLILWGTRSAETARLERRWVSGDVLTIPGSEDGKRVTKNGRAHTVPLLPLAGSVLGAQVETGPYFFPGRFSSDVPIRAGSRRASPGHPERLENVRLGST